MEGLRQSPPIVQTLLRKESVARLHDEWDIKKMCVKLQWYMNPPRGKKKGFNLKEKKQICENLRRKHNQSICQSKLECIVQKETVRMYFMSFTSVNNQKNNITYCIFLKKKGNIHFKMLEWIEKIEKKKLVLSCNCLYFKSCNRQKKRLCSYKFALLLKKQDNTKAERNIVVIILQNLEDQASYFF